MSESKDSKAEAKKDVKSKEVSKDKSATKSAKKEPMPTWLKVALGLAGAAVALVVLVLVIASMATSGAAKVSDEFIDSLQAGDGDTAYSLLSSEVKAVAPEDEFAAFVAQVGPILSTDENKTSQEVEKNDGVETALVTYEITGTDGIDYLIGVELVKEDGEWKVSNFDSDTAEAYEDGAEEVYAE